MQEKTDLKYLLEKYTTNTCTREEFNQLLELIGQDHGISLTNELHHYWKKAGDEATPAVDWKERFSSLLKESRMHSPIITQTGINGRTRLIRWASVAATLLLLAGGYLYYKMDNSHTREQLIPATIVSKEKEVAPGRNRAVLTLADGSVINLDSAKDGTIARQGNIKIIKGEDGELLYYVDRQSAAVSGFNTISTPRGGKYIVVLSDGTKVWLNAASSLRFPASFVDKTRDVTLMGEGYFEVAKDAFMPFHVKANNVSVEVLGTHFNVNAYSDESSVATTLLEGSVKIRPPALMNNGAQPAMLKPGERAEFTTDGTLKIDQHANTQEVVAWKNNNFEFENTPIPVIMRQISRWYDVEVEYKGGMPEHRLTGKFSRNVSLSQLIGMLQYTGLNMKVENKRIFVRANR